MESVSDMSHLVDRLVDLECWYAFTDSGTSGVTLAFGDKVPRHYVNPRFPPDDPRQFRGEYSLWIQCPWRLEHHDLVLVVSSDFGDKPDWGVERGLSVIFGQAVVGVAVAAPAWDLTIEFEGGHLFKAFCEVPTYDSPDGDQLMGMAWTLGGPQGFGVTVGPRGRWSIDY